MIHLLINNLEPLKMNNENRWCLRYTHLSDVKSGRLTLIALYSFTSPYLLNFLKHVEAVSKFNLFAVT